MGTEVGWKMGGRKRRGGGREGKKRKTFLRPCSAETRFQGIATGCPRGAAAGALRARLAVLRPVFRGLRRGWCLWVILIPNIACLQC